MKLVLLLTAEFIHMITASLLIVILYLGGWHHWGIRDGTHIGWLTALLRVVVLLGKVCVIIFLFMLIRWTWPRFRFDQLMALGWKVMLPLGLVNLVTVTFLVELQHPRMLGGWCQQHLGSCTPWVAALVGWLVAVAAWLVVAAAAPKISDNRPSWQLDPYGIDAPL
jgi:NADH-quinone oxidoreductase subunit H